MGKMKKILQVNAWIVVVKIRTVCSICSLIFSSKIQTPTLFIIVELEFHSITVQHFSHLVSYSIQSVLNFVLSLHWCWVMFFVVINYQCSIWNSKIITILPQSRGNVRCSAKRIKTQKSWNQIIFWYPSYVKLVLAT